MAVDTSTTPSSKLETDFALRERAILDRIKVLYEKKLKRELCPTEVQDIANNLKCFAEAVYGIKE